MDVTSYSRGLSRLMIGKIDEFKEACLMKRKEAVESAMASLEMEGFVFTEEEKAMFAKLAKGEIDYNDVFVILEKKLETLKKERPEIFDKEQ